MLEVARHLRSGTLRAAPVHITVGVGAMGMLLGPDLGNLPRTPSPRKRERSCIGPTIGSR